MAGSNKDKGDFLEDVVQLIEKSFAGKDCAVEKKKKFINRDDLTREIDVFLSTIVNKKTIGIAIECKNYKPNISLEKIDSFINKCRDIPQIHRMVYVTTSDYQCGAKVAAEKAGVSLYRLQRISDEKVEATLNIKKDFSFIEQDIQIKQIFLIIENKIYLKTDQAPLFTRDGVVLKDADIKKHLFQLKELKEYFQTKLGVAFGLNKTVFSTIKAKGVFTHFKGEITEVNDLLLIVTLNIFHKELKIDAVFQYVDGENILANYGHKEFVINDTKTKLGIVNDGENKFYLDRPGNGIMELKKLGDLSVKGDVIVDIPIPDQFIRDIPIPPLSYGLSSDFTILGGDSPKKIEQNERLNTNVYLLINDETKKLQYMIPIIQETDFAFGRMPDPLSLFISNCIRLYNETTKYKHLIVESTDPLKIWADADYHLFIQTKINCVLMLKTTIDFFVNQCIPDEIELEGKQKPAILTEITLKDKIEKILTVATNYKLEENIELTNTIFSIDDMARIILNMPASSNAMPSYLEIFEKITNVALKDWIDQTILFMGKNGFKPMIMEF